MAVNETDPAALQAQLVATQRDLDDLRAKLAAARRKEQMSEIASSILHNVGNVLNRITVSAVLMEERLNSLRIDGIGKLAGLLAEHSSELATFLREDPRGKQIPQFLQLVADQLHDGKQALARELAVMKRAVEHIEVVVASRKHLRSVEKPTEVELTELVNVALDIILSHSEAIDVHRSYEAVPRVTVDPHAVLQIMLNLISNARHSVTAAERPDKTLRVHVCRSGEDMVCIEVSDNGVGISEEDIERIFTRGFTTKPDGQGMGLHSSAHIAASIGGTLTVHSPGRGMGATFALRVPLHGQWRSSDDCAEP